jgi:EmrB/QacA subfamily drug resistance transporter
MITEDFAPAIDPRIHARRWRTLAVLALSLVIIGLDNTILNVALPSLQTHFGAGGSTLQWMVDAYLLSFAGLLLLGGALGDRFGRKKALITGLSVFGGASLAVLAVDTSGQLIAVRALMGTGAALIMPATLSIITNVFPVEERAKAIGVWAGMAAVGIGFGPLIGGLLLHWFSWSSIFLVNVPVAAAAVVLGTRLVPESRDPRPGRFDYLGAIFSGAAVLSGIYAIIEAPGRGWTDPVIVTAFVLAIGLMTLFVRRELRVTDPMLNLDFFHNPRFSVGMFAIAAAFFALLGSIFGVTQYLQFAHGYSALEAGAAMVPLALGLVIGAGSSTKLVPRIGAANVVALGLTALGTTLITTVFWTPEMPYWPLGLWFFGGAVAMGWTMAPATDAVMGAVPLAKAGVASAMNDVARQVAGALGIAVIGSLSASLYSDGVSGDVARLPGATRVGAQDSIGAAHAVALRLPAGRGRDLINASAHAYTDALGIALVVAAAIALVAAVIVRRHLPAQHMLDLLAVPVAGVSTLPRPRAAVTWLRHLSPEQRSVSGAGQFDSA